MPGTDLYAVKILHRPKTAFGNAQKNEMMEKEKYQERWDGGDKNRAMREPLL